MIHNHVLSIFVAFAATILLARPMPGQDQDNRPNAGMRTSGGGQFGMGIGPMGYISLLSNDKVLKELDLTDDQKTKLSAAVGEATDAMLNDKKNAFRAVARGGNPQDLGSVMLKIMKSNQDKLLKKLAKILQPDQFERLKQIHMQADGSMALFDPEVIKALNITAEQQEKMKALLDDFQNTQRQNATGYQTSNSGGGMAKIDGKMTRELGQRLSDVLTPDQRAEFDKLKGPKADIGSSSFKMKHSDRNAQGMTY